MRAGFLERLILIVLLGAAALARVCIGWEELGLYWPDEIYQSLEPAHRLVFGYGLLPWEYIEGARNWTFPALIAVGMKLSIALGAGSPDQYLRAIRMMFAGLGVLATWGTYRLALLYRVPPVLALAGGALFAFNAVSLYFSHRALSEVASTPLIVWGLVLLLEDRASRRQLLLWLGASLLGLSVLIRLQNGLFCVAAIAILLGQGRWRDSAVVFGVLCLWAAALGMVDQVTWGGWFHSALTYLRFNLIEGRAADWGSAPFAYYGYVGWTAMQGPALLLLLIPFAIRRATGLTLTCLAFVALLGLTPHKELRFLFPAFPLMFAAAAVGADTVASLLRTRHANAGMAVLFVILAFQSAARLPGLRFADLGSYEYRPHGSIWGESAPVNRLLLVAHGQTDICGLKVEAVNLAWTGGQSYLHRPIPLYPHTGPERSAGVFNYVISRLGSTAEAEVVAADGGFTLARLPNLTCKPDPNYSANL